MLTSILNSSQIYVIPYRGTSLDLSPLVPIESHEILAQAWTSGGIYHIQAKANILIALDLQINISSIYSVIYFLEANQFLNDITQQIWCHKTKIQVCRYRQGNCSTGSILAIRHRTDSHMSGFTTLVCQIDARISSLTLEQIQRYLVPLAATSLVNILHSMLWIDCIQTWCRIRSDGTSNRSSNLYFGSRSHTHTDLIHWQLSQQMIVNCLTKYKASLHWYW